MSEPLLSIVVPVYNVANYLAECLTSLKHQTWANTEIIMVDDGSTDNSAEICAEWATKNPNFKLVQQANQGLGPARNTGASHAQGDYLTFVDSDDIVPLRAYAMMLESLEKSGSSLAAGDVRRFTSLGVTDSFVHTVPFAENLTATHVSEFNQLALDRMAWNKVYRHQFFKDQKFSYPAQLYEDYPVTIRSHVLAEKVDVLKAPVYYWRNREADQSITQRVFELANLTDRVASDVNVLDFVAAEAPYLNQIIGKHLLFIDLVAINSSLLVNEPENHPKILQLAQQLLRHLNLDWDTVAPPYLKVLSQLVRNSDLPRMLELAEYRHQFGIHAPITAKGILRKKYYANLPFFADKTAKLAVADFELQPEQVWPKFTVAGLKQEHSEITVELQLQLNTAQFAATDPVKINLVNQQTRIPLTIAEITQKIAAKSILTTLLVKLNTKNLPIPANPAVWLFEAEIKHQHQTHRLLAKRSRPGVDRLSLSLPLTTDVWLATERTGDGFGIRVRHPKLVLSKLVASNNCFELTAINNAAEPPTEIELWPDEQPIAKIRIPISTKAANGDAFSVQIPAADLVITPDQSAVLEPNAWLLRANFATTAEPIAIPPNTQLAQLEMDSRLVSAHCSQRGNLIIFEGANLPQVSGLTYTEAALIITGNQSETPAATSLIGRDHDGNRYLLAENINWEQRNFTIELPWTKLAELTAPKNGNILLRLQTQHTDLPILVTDQVFASLPGSRKLGDVSMQPRVGRGMALTLELK